VATKAFSGDFGGDCLGLSNRSKLIPRWSALRRPAVVGFDWDPGNARKRAVKHSVSQAEAEQPFLNAPLLVVRDPKHSQHEARFHALGETDDGRRLHISFTLRADGSLIRVISARDMHRKERIVYEQATQDST